MRGRIDHFSNPTSTKKQFVAWEELTGAYAPTYKLFNIGAPVKTLEYEIAIEEETVVTGTLGLVAWDDTDTTGLSVSAALAWALTNYAVIKVDNEIVAVKSVDRVANTIEVYARGMWDTVAASHLAGASVLILGFNMPRWVKDIEANFKEQVVDWNIVGKYTVPALSYTKEAMLEMRNYYDADGFNSFIATKMLEKDKDLIESMNKLVIHGTRERGTETSPSQTRWLLEEAKIRGNYVPAFGALTSLKKFDDALTASRNKKGKANILLVSSDVYDLFQGLGAVENQKPQILDRLNVEIGEKVLTVFTKIGQLSLVLDLDMPTGTALVFNQADISLHPFVGFTIPGWDRKTAQESTRNDQAFLYDTISQVGTLFKNSNKNMTIIEGITA